MIFGALKGTALKKAGPFYEDFIEFLDRLNLDSTRVSRANDQLHGMRMKDNQRWPDFFALWSNKLTKARGDFWPDENKTSMLRSSLSKNLSKTLAGNHLGEDDDFREWVRIKNKVAQQVEMTESRFNYSKLKFQDGNEASQKSSRGYFENSQSTNLIEQNNLRKNATDQMFYRPGDMDDSGDTIMGSVNTAGIKKLERRRALWKSKAQIEKLRVERRGFRCERQGCVSGKCPLLPAIKPKSKKLEINSILLPEISPLLYSIDEDNTESSEESEN